VGEVEIIGSGFLAKSLAPLAGTHHGVTVFVSGVSSAAEKSEVEFAREARLLHEAMRMCRETGRLLVYFSTTSVGMYALDHVDGRAGREDGPVYPGTQYARHKLSMEMVITASGAEYLILRLATPVGPQQRAHQFLPAMINQVCAGKVSLFLGARRDLIDIDHVVLILDELLRTGVRREVVNVGSGIAVPIEEIVSHLESRLGRQARWITAEVPAERAVSIGKLRRLVPAIDSLGFDAGYYRTVIDRYLRRRLPEETSGVHDYV
jgi:nucleoside-diphosphate-sugar epimerase